MPKVLSRTVIALFLLVAFVGFLDAAYLTANHYADAIPPCFVVQGCEEVTTSKYSKILGIPVALLGLLYYLSLLGMMLYYVDKRNPKVLPLISVATTLGFLFSLWFLYAQTFLIKSFCTYCLFSAATSTILFGFGIYIWRKRKDTSSDDLGATITIVKDP